MSGAAEAAMADQTERTGAERVRAHMHTALTEMAAEGLSRDEILTGLAHASADFVSTADGPAAAPKWFAAQARLFRRVIRQLHDRLAQAAAAPGYDRDAVASLLAGIGAGLTVREADIAMARQGVPRSKRRPVLNALKDFRHIDVVSR